MKFNFYFYKVHNPYKEIFFFESSILITIALNGHGIFLLENCNNLNFYQKIIPQLLSVIEELF